MSIFGEDCIFGLVDNGEGDRSPATTVTACREGFWRFRIGERQKWPLESRAEE